MSDLFCPATVLVTPYVVPLGQAEPSGRAGADRARRLAESLRDRRVAAVWCAEGSAALQTAKIVAGALDVPVEVRKGLSPLQPGEDVAEVRAVLEEAVDQFRGETVLVVGDAAAIGAAVSALIRNAPPAYARDRQLVTGEVGEMQVDADGWLLTEWAGERVEGR